MKRFLFYWIENFTERKFEIFHNNERNTSTINDKRNMSYKYHMKQRKHTVENNLNQIFARKPHLIILLNRNGSHPFIGKFFQIPFNI